MTKNQRRGHQAELAHDLASCVAVYDGQRCIGHVLLRGKLGFEAFDADDRSLDLFPDQASAVAAIDKDWGRP